MKEHPFKDNYRIPKRLSELKEPEEKKKPVRKKAVLYVRKKSN